MTTIVRDVHVEVESGTATVTLNRPHQLNAIRSRTKTEMLAVLRDLDERPNVRVVVLTGSGRAFCAGADLHEIGHPGHAGEPLQILKALELTQTIVRTLQCMSAVTIAAVNGVVAGGGLGLVLGCDVAVATRDAEVVFAFPSLGLVPDAALTNTLRAAVGARTARYLLLTRTKLDASEALDRGIYDEVVDADLLPCRVQEIGTTITDRDPLSIALTKRLHADTGSPGLLAEASAQAFVMKVKREEINDVQI